MFFADAKASPEGLRMRARALRERLSGGYCETARHLELAADEIERLKALMQKDTQSVVATHKGDTT